MKDLMLLIFPITLLVITFFGAKPCKDTGAEASDEHYDPLCLSQSKMIRGAACVWVVLHHLTQDVTTYGMYPRGPISILNYCGILFTSVFFFFSGFGLITGLITRPGYLKGFLKKRLLSVIIPFWTINALLVFLSINFYGIRYNTRDIISDITGYTLINSNGWYIIEIILFYILFYLCFRFIKNKKAAALVLSIAVVFVIRYAFFRGHDNAGDKSHWFKGEWWYNSTIVFVFGLWYGLFRDRVEGFFKKHYRSALISSLLLFLIVFYASINAVNILGYYRTVPLIGAKADPLITLILQSIACILSTLTVLLINSKLRLGNKVLSFLAYISTELFLIHGFFISHVFNNRGNHPFRFFTLVQLCSIASAAVLSFIIKKITKAVLSIGKASGEKTHETISKETGGGSETAKTDNNTADENINNRSLAAAKSKTTPAIIIKLKSKKYILPLCIVILLILPIAWQLILLAECKTETATLQNAGIGDAVYYGRFDTDGNVFTRERLKWIVLDRRDDHVLLICEKGIAGSSYNQKSEEVSWSECDIRGMINSKKYTGMFSTHELKNVMENDGDLISLLTVDEAEKFFDDDMERQLDITPAAEAAGTNINRMTKTNNWDMKNYRSAWWWLKKSSDDKAITAPIVTSDGEIRPDEKYVNKPYGAVRPVIRVRTPAF